MELTAESIMTALSILAVVMLIIVLYHVLFIVVDVRKIVRRLEDITQQVEAVILKPISMADQVLTFLIEQIEGMAKKKEKHGKHHKVIDDQ